MNSLEGTRARVYPSDYGSLQVPKRYRRAAPHFTNVIGRFATKVSRSFFSGIGSLRTTGYLRRRFDPSRL